MGEYNKLTKRLIAEGYTCDNFPKNVKIAGGKLGSKNPLDNLYGGFEYITSYSDERIYETPCGLLCKGRSTFTGMLWRGKAWTHEEDSPILHCPLERTECPLRPEPFKSHADGINKGLCPVYPSQKPYDYDNSAEKADKEKEVCKRQKKHEFIESRKGRVCENYMKWNMEKQEWEMTFTAYHCKDGFCNGTVYCGILGRPLSRETANIYYDIEIEGRDYSKDGTFFEGERYKRKIKDIQVCKKPISIDACKMYLKLQKEHIEWLMETNVLPKQLTSWVMFKKRLGEYDINWKMVNVRIEKKVARDLDQDLADIENGIEVTHVFDEEKARKNAKRERAQKRKEAEIMRQEKLILRKGLIGMNESEVRRAAKVLGENHIIHLNNEYKRKQKEAENAPVQLNLFDFLGKGIEMNCKQVEE